MTGVEILNVTEHAIMEPAWSWSMCFGLFIGLLGFGVLVGFIQGAIDCDIGGGIIAGLIIGLICALLSSPLLTAIFSKKRGWQGISLQSHHRRLSLNERVPRQIRNH